MNNMFDNGGATVTAETGTETMNDVGRKYLPAAGRDWALPLYDPIVKLMGGDRAKRALLNQAGLGCRHRVLDIGCGTGSLAVLIKQLHPDAKVLGLDPDARALARARQKAERAGAAIAFDQGFSDNLPYPDASFDRVFSSFMFHHVPKEAKEKTVVEARRVLAPGGSLHLLDFERQQARAHGFAAHRRHASEHVKDSSENRLLALMRRAGFASVQKVGDDALLFGLLRIGYYRASV